MSALAYYRNSFRGYWPTARALSPSLLPTCFLFLALLSIPVRKRLFGRQPMRLRLSLKGERVNYFVRDGTDISALREIFSENEYFFDVLSSVSPKRIVDLGAHIGASILYFRRLFPEAWIIAYEPDPENFRLLTMNVGALPRVECVNAAVSGTFGKILFYPNRGGSTMSSTTRLKDSDNGIEVASVRLDEVMQKGADLVKFDIEGAEYEMFAAASLAALKTPQLYIGEAHHYLIHKTREEFHSLFPGYSAVWKDRGVNISIVALTKHLQ